MAYSAGKYSHRFMAAMLHAVLPLLPNEHRDIRCATRSTRSTRHRPERLERLAQAARNVMASPPIRSVSIALVLLHPTGPANAHVELRIGFRRKQSWLTGRERI